MESFGPFPFLSAATWIINTMAELPVTVVGHLKDGSWKMKKILAIEMDDGPPKGTAHKQIHITSIILKVHGGV